jgi:hypothetical protein
MPRFHAEQTQKHRDTPVRGCFRVCSALEVELNEK